MAGAKEPGKVGPEGLGRGLEGNGRGPEVWRVPFGGPEWVLGKSQNKFKILAGKKRLRTKHQP